MRPFRIGITPDFYVEAAGRFERVLERELRDAPGVEYSPMPPQPGKVGTPEALNQFDGIFALGLRIDARSLVDVDRLVVVARWGVGYDRIDVAALTEADVLLAITPNAVRRPVAEAIVTLIFALSKNLVVQDRTTRTGKWRGDLPRLGFGLRGRVLGSIGCGNIAQEMFRLCSGFGFSRMLAYDPYLRTSDVAGLNIELTDKGSVLRQSDFVAINAPLNAVTRGLIGEKEFRMMKPEAFFINTARGALVQEDALVRALRERWICGAGIDVFEPEPPGAENPLFELDNVIVAPHALAWTDDLVRDNGTEACRNLLAVARGDLPGGIVNREVLDRPGFRRKLQQFADS